LIIKLQQIFYVVYFTMSFCVTILKVPFFLSSFCIAMSDFIYYYLSISLYVFAISAIIVENDVILKTRRTQVIN
jgi:hypothetical protein